MDKFNYEVIATKRAETRWTVAAKSEEQALGWAREVCANHYLEAVEPRIDTDYEVQSVKLVDKYEPTYLVTMKGYYMMIENFTVDYEKAGSVYCRTTNDMHTVLKVVHGQERDEVQGGELVVRKMDDGKYQMTDDRSMHDVFTTSDISTYIKNFEL